MANMAKIEDKLAILPALPGCYLMKQEGDIIYVGKRKLNTCASVFCRRA